MLFLQLIRAYNCLLFPLLQYVTCYLLYGLPSISQAIDFDPILSPDIDLSQLGRIAFTGAFDALSQVQYDGQAQASLSAYTNGSQYLRQQLPNGDFVNLLTADAPIDAMCPFLLKDGTLAGVLMAGNFTSAGGIEAQAIIMVDPSSGKITPLPGLSGQVTTLFCDQGTGTFYAAGAFVGGNSSNLLAWVGAVGWTNLPFAGFNGPINAVSNGPDQTLIFGGTFDDLGQGHGHFFNGLFQWDPNAAVGPVSHSYNYSINQIGTTLDPHATVNGFGTWNYTIFVAGNFTGPHFRNIFLIENGQAKTLYAGGVNGEIESILVEENLLFVGGDFNDTVMGGPTGLNHVAMYAIPESKWEALGAGVNGLVTHVNPLLLNLSGYTTETVVVVNGLFDELLAFDGNEAVPTDGIGVWVPSAKNWLSNLNITRPAIYGQLTSFARVPGSGLLITGSLTSYGLSASEVISFSYDSGGFRFGDLGLKVSEKNESGGVRAGLFYTDAGIDITVIGGTFTAQGTDGTDIHDLAFINETGISEISGILSDDWRAIAGNAEVVALATSGHMLFAGGLFQGRMNGEIIGGILCYDLIKNDFTPNQPPPLTGADATVNAIASRPNANEMYIGGSFTKAGTVDCPGVCILDVSSSTWRRPGTSLEGVVDFLTWTAADTLVVGGRVLVGNSSAQLSTYYAADGTWTPFGDDVPVPENITAMSRTQGAVQNSPTWSSNAAGFWIAGGKNDPTSGEGSADVLLLKWNGTTWQSVDNVFSNGTRINGMQEFSLSSEKTVVPNPFLDPDQILLIWGDLRLPTIGNVSAAFFNGTTFSPFILTETISGEPGQIFSMLTQQRLTFNALPSNTSVIAVAIAVLSALVLILVIGESLEFCRRNWVRWTAGYTEASQNVGKNE